MIIELQRFHYWAKEHGVRSQVVAKESLGKGTGLFLSLAKKRALADDEQEEASARDSKQETNDEAEPLLFVPTPLLLCKSRVFALTDCEPLQRTYRMLGGYDKVTERMSLILFLIYERLAVQESNRKEAQHCERVAAKAAARAQAEKDGTLDNSNQDGSVTDEETDDDEDWHKGSMFQSYVAVLPDISTPVTLTTEVVQGYLAGTLLLDSVCAKRSRLEAEYANLSGARGIFEHWKVHPTLDDYIWADATFWSRVLSFQSQRDYEASDGVKDRVKDRAKGGASFSSSSSSSSLSSLSSAVSHSGKKPDDLHMVPFLDFANHATQPNIRWYVDDDGLYVLPPDSEDDDAGAPEVIENNSRSVPVQIPVKANPDKPTIHSLKETHQELFLSYGDKSNMELLYLYGFMLSNNPVKVQTIAMPMDEEDPYYMPKAHTLMRMGLLPRVTAYLDSKVAPADVVEICSGLWITTASRDLLWIYALNEEDGVGAELEEPALMVCKVHDSTSDDEEVEEADLGDEDEIGRLMLTIQGEKIETRRQLHKIVPRLAIYPVLALRVMVMLADRLEYYISRITDSGDRVSKTEGVEIVRAIHYDSPQVNPSTPEPLPVQANGAGGHGDGDGDSGNGNGQSMGSPERQPPNVPAVGKIRLEASSRLGYTLSSGRDSPGHNLHHHHVAVRPCRDTVAIEQGDETDALVQHQKEVEAQVSTLVQIMKAYRHEELQMLIHFSDRLGQGQVHYLENNTAVQEYLARMQAEQQEAEQESDKAVEKM